MTNYRRTAERSADAYDANTNLFTVAWAVAFACAVVLTITLSVGA